jgi:hypothetical protein
VTVTGNAVGRFLFGAGLRDVTNGFRAVRLEDHARWPLVEQDFASITEELYWAVRSGIKPTAFPTVLNARGEDQRPTAFDYAPDLVWRYLRWALRAAGWRTSARLRGQAVRLEP